MADAVLVSISLLLLLGLIESLTWVRLYKGFWLDSMKHWRRAIDDLGCPCCRPWAYDAHARLEHQAKKAEERRFVRVVS